MLLLRRRPPSTLLPGDWVWPLAMYKGKRALITVPFGTERSGPGGIRHRGVDLAYGEGAMPEGQAALAAADGVVWSALPTPFGFAIVIDHAPLPFTTYYAHLEKLLVEHAFRGDAKQRVRAGQAIGIVGHDLLDPSKRRHLHFELWRDTPASSIDPAPFMRRWDVMPDPRDRTAKLVFRHIGAPGTPYPPWLRDLLGQKSGIYVILWHIDAASGRRPSHQKATSIPFSSNHASPCGPRCLAGRRGHCETAFIAAIELA